MTRGFTLAEVLVALAILAGSLLAAFEIYARASDAFTAAERERVAVGHARNLLARLGPEIPVVRGLVSGTLPDGMRWRLSIAPRLAPRDDEDDEEKPPLTPFDVSLTIGWRMGGSERSYVVDTVRLAPR